MSLAVEIQALPHAEGLPLPRYETDQAAGMDLLAALPADVILKPGQHAVIPAGIAIALPVGYEAQVRPRSGLAAKHGVTVLNAPGTVDADYRGEVGVILINHGAKDFSISRGMRIAQLVIAPVTRIGWTVVEQLSATERGAGGFGSTGLGAGGEKTSKP